MKYSQNKIKLTQVLAKKLSPLTLAIAYLISLTTPTTYYAIESRSLKKTTHLFAVLFLDLDRFKLINFAQPNFVATISQILRETGFPPQNLRLEITESTISELPTLKVWASSFPEIFVLNRGLPQNRLAPTSWSYIPSTLLQS